MPDDLSVHQIQIRDDWQHFIRSGFGYDLFTPALAEHLAAHCGLSQGHFGSREALWSWYFNNMHYDLRHLLDQFGGDQRSLNAGSRAWLDGPQGVLNRALCRAVEAIYEALVEALNEMLAAEVEMVLQTDERLWADLTPVERQAQRQARREALTEQALIDGFYVDEGVRTRLREAMVGLPEEPGERVSPESPVAGQLSLLAPMLRPRPVSVFEAAPQVRVATHDNGRRDRRTRLQGNQHPPVTGIRSTTRRSTTRNQTKGAAHAEP